MLKKEKLDELFTTIPEEKKDEFIVEFRGAETKEAKKEVLEKYGLILTEEDESVLFSNELEDEELDQASGGCKSRACS